MLERCRSREASVASALTLGASHSPVPLRTWAQTYQRACEPSLRLYGDVATYIFEPQRAHRASFASAYLVVGRPASRAERRAPRATLRCRRWSWIASNCSGAISVSTFVAG